MNDMTNDRASNGQRALWTFLMFTLAGPFLAALAIAAALILAPAFRLATLLPADLPNAGAAALRTFIWAAIPAAVAAVVLLPGVLRKGTFGWLAAALAAVAATAIASVVLPTGYDVLRPAFLMLAGSIGWLLHRLLSIARIIADGDEA